MNVFSWKTALQVESDYKCTLNYTLNIEESKTERERRKI